MKQAKVLGGLLVATFAGLIGCSAGPAGTQEIADPSPATAVDPAPSPMSPAAPVARHTLPLTKPPMTGPVVPPTSLPPTPVALGAIDYGTPMSFAFSDKAARVLTFAGVAGDDITLDVVLGADHAAGDVLAVSLLDAAAATIATGNGGAPSTVTLPSDGIYTIITTATLGAPVTATLSHVAKGITCNTTITPVLPGSCPASGSAESNVVVSFADTPARLTIHSTGVNVAAGMGLGPPQSPTDFTGTMPVLDQFMAHAASTTTSATLYGDGAVRVNLAMLTSGYQPGGPPGQQCRVTFMVHCTGLGKL